MQHTFPSLTSHNDSPQCPKMASGGPLVVCCDDDGSGPVVELVDVTLVVAMPPIELVVVLELFEFELFVLDELLLEGAPPTFEEVLPGPPPVVGDDDAAPVPLPAPSPLSERP